MSESTDPKTIPIVNPAAKSTLETPKPAVTLADDPQRVITIRRSRVKGWVFVFGNTISIRDVNSLATILRTRFKRSKRAGRVKKLLNHGADPVKKEVKNG